MSVFLARYLICRAISLSRYRMNTNYRAHHTMIEFEFENTILSPPGKFAVTQLD